MQNRLLAVAYGILDSNEFLEQNLEDWVSVQDYAYNGMDILLNRHQCELIRLLCLRYPTLGGSNAIYHEFEAILMDL